MKLLEQCVLIPLIPSTRYLWDRCAMLDEKLHNVCVAML
jgi:hypothetical protein